MCCLNVTLKLGQEQSAPSAAPPAQLAEVAVIRVHRSVSVREEEFPGVSASLQGSGRALCIPRVMGARQQQVCHGDCDGIPAFLHLSCLYLLKS